MPNNVHPTQSGASVLKIACEGKLFGTTISKEKLALTADQLRQIVTDHGHMVVRRPDGSSLTSFDPERLNRSPHSYYTS